MNSPTDLQMRTVGDEVDPSDGDHAQDIDGGPGVATWQPDEWDEEDVDSTDSDEDDVEMSTPGAVNPEEAQLVSFTSVSPDLAEHPLVCSVDCKMVRIAFIVIVIQAHTNFHYRSYLITLFYAHESPTIPSPSL